MSVGDAEQVASAKSDVTPEVRANLGARRLPPLPAARFPDAGATVQTLTSSTRPTGGVDILLVNPPAPDGGIWIRSQHRVGRRSRENMIWPQVSLAQLAALLIPDYTVEVVDCIATRMGWTEFEKLLKEKRPRYYLTQVTAPTLRNDMYGVFLAKALGARTMAFGTHVTPLTLETMRPFPALDFILRGEPEMTLRELLDVCEGKTPSDPRVAKMLAKVKWTCNSRVDYVDEAMLRLMGQAGCWYVSWGIESANEAILKRVRKGYRKEQALRALTWAHQVGINNWGYFIIGLPGETEESIQETIAYAKALPLDICLFPIAAPYPGTPFFFEVTEKGWFRAGTKWEEVDMDQSTVLDYPDLPAERLEYWQRRATREWSLRPGPMLTFLKGMNSWEGFKSAVSVGVQTLRFMRG